VRDAEGKVAGKDRELYEGLMRLRETLHLDYDLDAYMDVTGLTREKEVADDLAEAMINADCFVCVVTSKFLEAPCYQRAEIHYALARASAFESLSMIFLNATDLSNDQAKKSLMEALFYGDRTDFEFDESQITSVLEHPWRKVRESTWKKTSANSGNFPDDQILQEINAPLKLLRDELKLKRFRHAYSLAKSIHNQHLGKKIAEFLNSIKANVERYLDALKLHEEYIGHLRDRCHELSGKLGLPSLPKGGRCDIATARFLQDFIFDPEDRSTKKNSYERRLRSFIHDSGEHLDREAYIESVAFLGGEARELLNEKVG